MNIIGKPQIPHFGGSMDGKIHKGSLRPLHRENMEIPNVGDLVGKLKQITSISFGDAPL